MSNLLIFFIQYFDGIDIVWVERVSRERHFVIFAGIISEQRVSNKKGKALAQVEGILEKYTREFNIY